MEGEVFFSLIVPTFNRAHLIGRTIESLLNQNYSNYEIIVVDDGSTDNTEAVISSFNNSRISYYKKGNAERGAARNFGAQRANGSYLNFFDSDDIAFENHLSAANKLLNSDKNSIEIFTLGYKVVSPEGQMQRIYNDYPQHLSESLFINGNILSCDAVFIRRDIALMFPFSEVRALSGSEDAVLWMRLAARYEWRFSNEVSSAIVDHESRSVLKIDKNKLIDRLHLFVKNVSEDEAVQRRFSDKLLNVKLEANSYAALHLILAGYKKESLHYLIKSILIQPRILFSRRSVATIKRLLF